MQKDLYIMGIPNFANYEANAALIRVPKNGGAIAYVTIGEDRLTRLKHPYQFPLRSIHYCLQAFGLESLEQIDYIFTDYARLPRWLHSGPGYRVLEHDYLKLKFNYPRERIFVIDHHDAHAASAFYTSGFDDAAVLSVDSLGSELFTQSLYHFANGKGRIMERGSDWGIGRAYDLVTGTVLPYGPEKGHGKVMGLAPYGAAAPGPVIPFQPNEQGMQTDYSNLFSRFPIPRVVATGLPRCEDRSRVLEPPFARAAYDVQVECERQMIRMAKYAYEKTGSKNICLAGGVALNGVANWRIFKETPFENVFTPPNCSDTGIGLGAALWGFFHVLPATLSRKYVVPMPNAYTGRTYSQTEILDTLEKYRIPCHKGTPADMAKKIAAGKVVAWFIGGSETGPRALGHRSILADPRSAAMKDHLNASVKMREGYRPYAPSVLAEHADEYLELDGRPSPFMLIVTDIKKDKRDVIPAVTHVDGTARPQTVTKKDNGDYYLLIEAFYKETGVPVLLNTSFNINKEPIVETPLDALICALGTQIDLLYMDGNVVDCEKVRDPELVKAMERDRALAMDEEYRRLTSRYLVDYYPAERDVFLQEANKVADWHRMYRAKYELEKAMDLWREKQTRVLIIGTRRHTACLYAYIPEFPRISVVGFVPMDDRAGERGEFNAYPEYQLDAVPWDQVDVVLISTHEYQRAAAELIQHAHPEKTVVLLYDNAADSLLHTLPGVWPVMNPREAREHNVVVSKSHAKSTSAVDFDFLPEGKTFKNRRALIVNYHYIHNPGDYGVAGLKGVTPAEFEKHLDALGRAIPFTTVSKLLDPDAKLPSLVAIVTIDDGLADMPRFALPILQRKKIPASWFVSSAHATEGKMLMVHKIHLLQAKLGVQKFREAFMLKLPSQKAVPLDDPAVLGIKDLYRYDDEETRTFKTLLNYQLPYELAEQVLDVLIEQYFGDQQAVLDTFYAAPDDLRACADAGIDIGLHTHHHYLMSRLPFQQQRYEISANQQYLADVLGRPPRILALPFGSRGTWSTETKRLLKELKCQAALTMERRVVQAEDLHARWEIPRFDVRDIFDNQGNLKTEFLLLQ